MSRLMITSDLHLGHDNAIKWRSQFTSPEEHNGVIFDNLCSSVNKRDTLLLLGDVAFTREWHRKINSINCTKKILILGNHDTERVNIKDLVRYGYDEMHSMYSKRNMWFTHCPMHDLHLRDKSLNVHGHLHEEVITELNSNFEPVLHHRYFNVCLEHTNYKPISFEDIKEEVRRRGLNVCI
jgi:calcineurin-like phosphoesterase family protein